jgi:hypothetical protein
LQPVEPRDSVTASPRWSLPMPPKSSPPEQPELFRSALVNLVDRRHPLVRLADLIDWERFATAFGPLYRDGVGRPGLPTRLMVGLHLIKHMDGLSDEAVCARFLDSPYVQCTAPGSLDTRLHDAARLRLVSRRVARASRGPRKPFFSTSHSAL